jgi:hypothetical protein
VIRRIGLAAGLASLGFGALAGAYPIAAPGQEAPVGLEPALLVRGPWLEEQGALGLRPGSAGRRVWVSERPTDDFVRLRLRGDGRADLALLFRARVVRPEVPRLAGYGFSVQQREGYVDFLRWDPGGVRDGGARQEVAGLKGRTDLEVCLWLAGPHFVAQVFDGRTKDLLASLSFSDPTYPQGSLGLYVRQGDGSGPSMQLWMPVPRSAPAGTEPEASGPGTPLARRWLAWIRESDFSRLPSEVRGRFQRAERGPEGTVALISSRLGLEVLREHNLETLRFQPGVPFRLIAGRSAARGPPVVSGGRARLPAGLKDPEQLESALAALAAAHPDRARLLEYGRSAEGRPLLALRVGAPPEDRARPGLLLTAGVHPREASTPEFPLDAALELLQGKDRRRTAWLEEFSVVVVPLVNPDGAHAFWHLSSSQGRKSRRTVDPAQAGNPGVDLNRNFPFRWGSQEARFDTDLADSDFYRGPGPASEPEVAALVKLAEEERFVAAVSYHAQATKLLVPYTVASVPDPEPHLARMVAEELMPKLQHVFGKKRYELVRGLYPVTGVEQDHLFHTHGTLAYLLEVPWSQPEPSRLEEQVVHSRPLWQGLMDRFLRGPSLSLRVIDRDGRPVEAQVDIAEIRLRAGERWTTQPGTGYLFRYLPAPGRYTVRACLEGRTAERSVEAAPGGTTRVDMRL